MKRILFLLLACVCAAAQTSTPPAHNVLYAKCGRLVYDAEKPALSNAGLVITDGKITAMGTDVASPAGAQSLDLSRDTCVPGLIDAHIHLWTGGREIGTQPSPPLAALRASKSMAYALNSGVVAVRVLGSMDFIDVALGNAIDQGIIPGPHVIPAGHALSIPAGHGDFLAMPYQFPLESYYTPLHGFINSPADAEKAVHLQIKYGAKVIKVLASGGVLSPLDSPAAEQLSPEELRVIVEQAHMQHLKVAAHDENLPTIMVALNAGVDSIEHGTELDDAAINFMKQHHVFLVPTLFIADNIIKNGERMKMPDYVVRKAKGIGFKQFASYKKALADGVTIAAGSDQSYEPGKGTLLDEIITEVEMGMTPQQALVSATRHGAELLGMDDLGTLETGKEGSFVAVEGDPLSNIQAIKQTRVVVFKGKVAENTAAK